MDRDQFQRIKALVISALDLPVAEREAFVVKSTEADSESRRLALGLLGKAEAGADDFLRPLPGAEPHAIDAKSTMVSGRYQIGPAIGIGGMGTVHRAMDRKRGCQRAIKILPAELSYRSADLERLVEEVKRAAKLQHPGIVSVHETGSDGGRHFYVMDLVDGHDLAKEIALRRGVEIPGTSLLPPERSAYFRRVAEIIRDVAAALGFAHKHGVLHRGIKTQNLLLWRDGRVQVADFGLSHEPGPSQVFLNLTRHGSVHSMSPEQAGAREHPIDLRTDLYSLGVVLYELLTLERAFEGRTEQEVLKAIRSHDPVRPRKLSPDVPADLEAICIKLMQKEPADRYPDPGELIGDLQRFLRGEPVSVALPGRMALGFRFLKSRRGPILLATVAISIVILTAYFLADARIPKGRLRIVPESGFSAERIEVYGLDLPLGGRGKKLGELPGEGGVFTTEEGGCFRILVMRRSEEPLEFSEWALVGRDRDVVVSRPRGISSVAMVRFQGGTIDFDNSKHARTPPEPYRVLRGPVSPFEIDVSEVTNAEYAAFIKDTNRMTPGTWGHRLPAERTSGWDRLPVTDVSVEDATAYAAWCGKRLPTAGEWWWAARGPEGRLYPWTGDRTPVESGANLYGENSGVLTGRDRVLDYLEKIQVAVPTSKLASTPEGLFHMLGNVSELTETPVVDIEEGVGPRVRIEWRVLLGGNVNSGGDVCLSSIARADTGQRNSDHRRGFRCARSVFD